MNSELFTQVTRLLGLGFFRLMNCGIPSRVLFKKEHWI